MEAKKTDKANLESKRSVFLQLGFVVSLSLILIAFEWTSSSGKLSEIDKRIWINTYKDNEE